MHADERGLASFDVAFHEGHMMNPVEMALVEVQFELAVIRGHIDDFDALDELFTLAAVGDEIGDAANLEFVLLGELQQIRQPGHGAIGIHDFDEHTGFAKSGETGQIRGGFRVACAAQHTAGLGDQRIDVTRLDEGFGAAFRIGEQADGAGAVRSADAGGDAFGGIDGDGESRGEGLAILRHHAFEAQILSDLRRNGHAEHARAFADHEGDHLRRDLFRRTDEIALVFAVGIVGDDHHAPSADVSDDGFHGITDLF